MSDQTICPECGYHVAYGERHPTCGTVADKYRQRIAELEAALAAMTLERDEAMTETLHTNLALIPLLRQAWDALENSIDLVRNSTRH